MAKIPFNVDAYTARLIGRENVSKLEGAIVELVKNSYDADATCCVLYYDQNKDTLYLADNGCGMTQEVIQKHWMTIGRSSKKSTFVSDKGRIQTGEKGIGRFALDRIADQCQMLTWTGKENEKILWTVDWNAFSSGINITEIAADLDKTNQSFDEFVSEGSNQHVVDLIKKQWKKNGTIFKLTHLREQWNDELLQKIHENLASLIPYELSSIYKIYCFGNKDTVETARVFSDLESFSNDYKIEFSVKTNQLVDIRLWRNEYDFGPAEDSILKRANLLGEKAYFHGEPIVTQKAFREVVPGASVNLIKRIGDFGGVLYFAKKSQTLRDKERFFQKDISGRRDISDTFGGIKIYRDNFRVRPYGEAKTSAYDWLQLARRKTASAAGVATSGIWRVRADQMVGSVFISRLNVALPDQSNREGIVETPEFILLQEFIRRIIEILERDRQDVYRKLDRIYREDHPVEKIQKDINQKARRQKRDKKEEIKEIPKTFLEDKKHFVNPEDAKLVLDAKDEQIEELESEIKMLRVLATTGIVTNTYIHEFRTQSHKLSMKIIMAKDALEKDHDMEEASRYINQANEIRESFNSWFQVTIDAIKQDKRKRKKLNLVLAVEQAVNSWNKMLASKHIEIFLKADDQEELFLRCFPYEIDTIISNLISNSTASFEKQHTEEKKIIINLRKDGEYIRIDYSDTGAGLAKMYKEYPEKTLEVFETDRRDASGQRIGTGMGMWIVNNMIQEYDGKIDLSRNRTEKTGYYITLYLRQRGE